MIGFSIAAPVGPIGILCIKRSLTEGWENGFVAGLGAATADAVYGCKNKLDTAKNDFKATRQKGQYYSEPLRLEFERTSRQISELNKKVRAIESNQNLSPEVKETSIKSLRQFHVKHKQQNQAAPGFIVYKIGFLAGVPALRG